MCMCVRAKMVFWMSSEYACACVSARTTNAVSELVMQLHWKATTWLAASVCTAHPARLVAPASHLNHSMHHLISQGTHCAP